MSDQVEHSPPIDDAGEHSGGLARRVASFLRLEEIPAALGLTEVRAAARPVWTPDFVVLCVLVAGTIMLGRPFSKEVKLPGGPIYVTEVAVVAMAAFALWRLRLGGVWARVRKVVPLVPLLVFWLAGAIATFRGLHTYGFHQIVPGSRTSIRARRRKTRTWRCWSAGFASMRTGRTNSHCGVTVGCLTIFRVTRWKSRVERPSSAEVPLDERTTQMRRNRSRGAVRALGSLRLRRQIQRNLHGIVDLLTDLLERTRHEFAGEVARLHVVLFE